MCRLGLWPTPFLCYPSTSAQRDERALCLPTRRTAPFRSNNSRTSRIRLTVASASVLPPRLRGRLAWFPHTRAAGT
jgi:hypothetical protein